MKKQIIIDYEEYLKLQKCYDIVNKKRYNNSYNYDEATREEIIYIRDTELLKLLNTDKDKIVITRG